jgi:signal transduction protein with GAF and PtsI domain
MKESAEINNASIFAAIRDINEVLSLSNEPHKFLNMALDTLAQVLKVECCWVQTINSRKKSLHLSAERGFSGQMRAEMAEMDMNHDYTKRVVGLGDEIIIPNVSQDGRYGLSSFRAAGYKWLIAAPLMTYRVHGVLGIASRKKKILRKDTADLVMVIAGLIGNALNKAGLSRETRPAAPAEPPMKKESPQASKITAEEPPPPPAYKRPVKPIDSGFHGHARKMKSFRKFHH